MAADRLLLPFLDVVLLVLGAAAADSVEVSYDKRRWVTPFGL